MYKLVLNIVTLTLMIAFAAIGQQKTTSPAEMLEEKLKPAKGTLESDVRILKVLDEEMNAAKRAILFTVKTMKEGPQPPTNADKAALARMLQAFMGKCIAYQSMVAAFCNHSAIFHTRIRDFLLAEKLDSAEEKKLLTKKAAEAFNWAVSLKASLPQNDPEKNIELFNETMAYLKAK